VADDPGVMGNLPRSRPGRRSEKRAGAGGAKRSKTAASANTRSKATTSRSKATTSRAKASTPKKKTTAPRTAVREERVEEQQGQDPITVALRAGMAVGDAGVKVLSKIVQRLPRP
jgi:hypothetical protein